MPYMSASMIFSSIGLMGYASLTQNLCKTIILAELHECFNNSSVAAYDIRAFISLYALNLNRTVDESACIQFRDASVTALMY